MLSNQCSPVEIFCFPQEEVWKLRQSVSLIHLQQLFWNTREMTTTIDSFTLADDSPRGPTLMLHTDSFFYCTFIMEEMDRIQRCYYQIYMKQLDTKHLHYRVTNAINPLVFSSLCFFPGDLTAKKALHIQLDCLSQSREALVLWVIVKKQKLCSTEKFCRALV